MDKKLPDQDLIDQLDKDKQQHDYEEWPYTSWFTSKLQLVEYTKPR